MAFGAPCPAGLELVILFILKFELLCEALFRPCIRNKNNRFSRKDLKGARILLSTDSLTFFFFKDSTGLLKMKLRGDIGRFGNPFSTPLFYVYKRNNLPDPP